MCHKEIIFFPSDFTHRKAINMRNLPLGCCQLGGYDPFSLRVLRVPVSTTAPKESVKRA